VLIRTERSQWQPQECGVHPQDPEAADLSEEELADAPLLPVCAEKVENWMVERRLPHFGHSAWPFREVTTRS